jgi:hypothetical protein
LISGGGGASLDEQKIRHAIAMLDDEVPREGARVKLSQYGGGPDEGQIVANRNGYLRLGIELLKGAFPSADEDSGSTGASVDLEYLVTDDSTINFDWFERREFLELDSTSTSATGWVIGLLFLGLTIGILLLAVIGAGAVIRWFSA